MPRGGVDYIEDPCEVQVRRETAILTWPSGLVHAVPLDVCRTIHRRIGAALAMHDHRQADIVPIGKKRG